MYRDAAVEPFILKSRKQKNGGLLDAAVKRSGAVKRKEKVHSY
jgi:hypothetical protein